MDKMGENNSNIEYQFKNLAARGFGFLIVKRILLQIILTGSNLILVRLLVPENFGQFTILQSLTSILWILGDFGIGRALVQSIKKPTREIIQTIFLLQVVLGIIIAGIGCLLAPYFLSFYRLEAPSLLFALQLLFVSQIFVNITSISSNMLERDMKYKYISFAEILGLFTTQGVTIFFAFSGMGVGSFIIGTVVGRIVLCIIYFLMYPIPFGFTRKLNGLKKIIQFGISSQVGILFSALNTTFIPLYLGKFPGAGNWSGFESVAFVTFSWGVAVTIIALSSILDQICFSFLSRLQHNKVTSQRVFILMMRLLAITTFFAGGVTTALAPELIRTIYTPEWLPANHALRFAVIQMVSIAFTSLALNALLAFGETKFYRNILILIAVVQWIFIFPLVFYFGFLGVVMSSTITSTLSLFSYIKLKKYFTIPLIQTIGIPFFAASFISIILFVLVSNYAIDSIGKLIFIVLVSFVVYSIILLMFLKKELFEYIIIAKKVLRQ